MKKQLLDLAQSYLDEASYLQEDDPRREVLIRAANAIAKIVREWSI